jgi:hypothetical protein
VSAESLAAVLERQLVRCLSIEELVAGTDEVATNEIRELVVGAPSEAWRF